MYVWLLMTKRHVQKRICVVLQGSKSSHLPLWKDILPSIENPFCWRGFINLKSICHVFYHIYIYTYPCINTYVHISIYTQYIYIYTWPSRALTVDPRIQGLEDSRTQGLVLLLLWDEHVGFLHSKMFNKNIGILWICFPAFFECLLGLIVFQMIR